MPADRSKRNDHRIVTAKCRTGREGCHAALPPCLFRLNENSCLQLRYLFLHLLLLAAEYLPRYLVVHPHVKERFIPPLLFFCYPAPWVLRILLISVQLDEGTDSDILMYFTAECLNQYLLVLSYPSYDNSRYLPDQSLTPAIITIRRTTTSLDRAMLHQRYDKKYSSF
jgi:hypothetical protein